jgi:NCS1 family nucleobase:cation symporter-1
VFLGNLIVLVPMLLIGDAGARYGIPYAVLARASFGTTGARLPAMMRALVACGWYGIQTWFGGEMIYTLGGVLVGHPIGGAAIAGLGINAAQLVCFLLFWAIELWYVFHGIEAIRKLETYTAPAKIIICALLLWYVYRKVGGFGPLLNQPSAFAPGGAKAGQFWSVFFPSLTAMVGFWATLALNIPDFTRFAKTRGDQAIGQAIGLPVPMGLLAVFSVLVTSGTVVMVDTVSVNLAANLVGPAYDFSSLSPRRISYRTGGMITAVIAIVMMPWKILASTHGYIFTWLIGYSALLGPIAGILIVDYLLIRKRQIDVAALYQADGRYRYLGGWNPAALVALVLSILPNLPGFLNAALPASVPHVAPVFVTLYTYSWFVGLAIAAIVYAAMMWRAPQSDAYPAGTVAR